MVKWYVLFEVRTEFLNTYYVDDLASSNPAKGYKNP
jgi:hypothetical protein